MTDQELVSRIIDGDKQLFEEILNKYERQIFVYILRMLNFHKEDAEDVTSQTFVKVYTNLAGYNQKMKFSSWLYRIAHNESVNLIRKKSKMFVDNIDDKIVRVDIDFDKPNKIDLEKILGKIKVEDRNILILFYINERTIREISDILKITEGSVKTRLSRARKRAQQIIK